MAIVRSNKAFEVEHARLLFRNFSGEKRKYNKEGDRNFNLVLTKEQADELAKRGYSVKVDPPREEDGDPQYRLVVKVSYKVRAPKVVLISDGHQTDLDEETIGELDYAEFENIDLSITPYSWEMDDGSKGVTAYLRSIYATLMEDSFAKKYADLPRRSKESMSDD